MRNFTFFPTPVVRTVYEIPPTVLNETAKVFIFFLVLGVDYTDVNKDTRAKIGQT